MKLTKITARNFKGQSFTLDLKEINLIVGSNFAGKTARTDAVRLVILGYLPELGAQLEPGKMPSPSRRASDTWGLSSGRDMVVEATFDNGDTITRRWYLKGDSVKYEVNGVGEDSFATEFGTQLAVMLNAEVYFSLGATDRVRYVFQNLPMGGARTVEKIIAEVKEELEKEACATEAIGEVVETMQAESDEEKEITPQDFVGYAIENVGGLAKLAKDHAAQMEKTIQGLTYLRTQDAPAVSAEVFEVEAGKLTKEVAALIESKGSIKAKADSEGATKKRRDDLTLAVKSKGGFQTRRDNLRNTLDVKEHELTNIPVASEGLVEELRAHEREAATALRDHERDLREVDSGIERCKKEFSEVSDRDCCPYCKAKGNDWKVVKVDEIASAIEGLEAKRKVLVDHIAQVRASAQDFLRRFNEARDAMNARRALNTEVEQLRKDIDDVEKQLALNDAKEEELANLPAAEGTATMELSTIESGIKALNQLIAENDTKRKAALTRAGELKRLAEAEEARDKAKIEEAVAKNAVDALKAIQTKMVEDAFGPLLKTANDFFPTVLKTPLAYNADKQEIGTWRSGVWVGHRTFSGTEKALCYAAIQAALASRSPIRIMLLDELGRLDAINAERLVGAIGQAIKDGKLDQFIGIDATNRYDVAVCDTEQHCQIITLG